MMNMRIPGLSVLGLDVHPETEHVATAIRREGEGTKEASTEMMHAAFLSNS